MVTPTPFPPLPRARASAPPARFLMTLLLLLLSPLLLSMLGMLDMLDAMAPKVRAEVNPSLPPIKGELQGTLSVYHSSRDHLDNLEARMNQAPLPVVFLFSTLLSTDERALYPDATTSDLVSVYRFLVPLPDPGLYPLPSISVKVGQQWVRSIPSNYQVQSEPIPTFLQLQAFVSPSLNLFPGQRARFVYRITYNQSMNLVVEELPLLKAKGFEKIGTERVEENDLPRATVQEITQEVRALQPGTYPFEESHIEGKLSKDTQAQKGAFKDTVPPLTVYVLPFPERNQPFFFSGALAPIKLQALLMTRDSVRIGDYCKLAIDVESTEETIDTFSPPDLMCQVGFPGFFRIDSQVQMQPLDSKTRRYLYQLHPISYHISAIPPVEMAAFDPQSRSYVRARSLPIPLHIETVGDGGGGGPHEQSLLLPMPLPEGEWRKQLSALKEPIDASLLLPLTSPSSRHLHLRPLLFYALCGCLGLLVQAYLYPKWLQLRRRRAPPLSLKLLQAGKWQEALLHKLYETKWIPSPAVEPERLPEKGITGKIRTFLVHLQAMRFAAPMPSIDEQRKQEEEGERGGQDEQRKAHELYGQISP